MNYLVVRNEAVSQIKAVFKADARLVIEAHPGSFSEAEIRRLVTRTPAILTALVRISYGEVQDESVCDFVSWIICRANNQDTLYDGALKIISALVPALRKLDTPWCLDGGTGIEADCMYSGSLDQINITLWAVKWRWRIRGIPEDPENFEGYDAVHEVGTQTAEDTINFGGG